MNKKIKQIKSLIKKQGEWKKYKKTFINRKFRLAFSQVVLITDDSISLEFLAKQEIVIASSERNEDMFVKPFVELEKEMKTKYDWKSFATFMFYVLETSRWWKGERYDNTFGESNFVKVNEEKREYFYKWLHSIPRTTEKYNKFIMDIMGVVY